MPRHLNKFSIQGYLAIVDCIIYKAIYTEHDSCCLQRDLNTILQWTEIWQVKLNIDECSYVYMHNEMHKVIPSN